MVSIHLRGTRRLAFCVAMGILAGVAVNAVATGNKARFICECDLGGVRGAMQLELEVIGTAGVIFGPGPTPDISGVVGTGDTIVYTQGEIRTENGGWFIFRGENTYADFTNMNTSARFRIRLEVDPDLPDRIWILSDPTDLATEGEFAFPCTIVEAGYIGS